MKNETHKPTKDIRFIRAQQQQIKILKNGCLLGWGESRNRGKGKSSKT